MVLRWIAGVVSVTHARGRACSENVRTCRRKVDLCSLHERLTKTRKSPRRDRRAGKVGPAPARSASRSLQSLARPVSLPACLARAGAGFRQAIALRPKLRTGLFQPSELALRASLARIGTRLSHSVGPSRVAPKMAEKTYNRLGYLLRGRSVCVRK